MEDSLFAHQKITSNFNVVDLYKLLDEFYMGFNNFEDFSMFSKDLWFMLRSYFYRATISHEENYDMILSDLPKILDNELNSKLELKLSEKNAEDALQFVINLLFSLVAYNNETTMMNFISILRCLEVETNVIKRFEFVYDSSRTLEHLHPVCHLKFQLSTDQVL